MKNKRVKKPKASNVPCGGCSLCCQGDLIVIRKEFGDRVSDYKVTRLYGAWVLLHKPNGDCIYLDRERGCTIHRNRPAVCREFDCRGLVKRIDEQHTDYARNKMARQMEKHATPEVVARGRDLLENER